MVYDISQLINVCAEEKLRLIMVDSHIPADAKLY